MNSKSSINEAYLEIDIIRRLESLEEYHGTKPLVLVNSTGEVLYSSDSTKHLFNITESSDIFKLKTEPLLSKLFEYLSENKLKNFCTDFLIEKDSDYSETYFLHIERVKISDEEIFIIYFDSHDNRKKLTKTINTYNQALESVSVGILIADRKADVKYISKTFEDFFNIRIEEIYNQNLIKAFNKYLSDLEIYEFELAISKGKSWVKVISDLNSEGEISYRELRMNVIKDNLDDSINYIITVNDITKHIQQARMIKKSEQRQRSIIENISDPILILRKDKNDLILESANSNFYSDIQIEKSGHQQETLFELVNPVLNAIICEAIDIIEDKSRVHAPFHYTEPIEKKRYLGKITYTDDQYDNSRLYIVNMTDITEQLEIERKLRDAYKKEISLNKLKSTFLANMSHEIRTPLNAIVGYSDLLEDDVKAMNYESSSRMTAYLKEGVNRLLKLVDNIVEVSLLESGTEEFQVNRISINNFINENNSDWIDKAKLRNVQIEFNLSHTNPLVEVNEEKLERAIKELVENAIKYNKEGGKIYISTGEDEVSTILQIADTGIGIEKDSLQKIFGLFEQVEQSSYTRKYEGAGLGLSLSNKLISFMNGKMSIASQLNEGTTVTISFPKKIKK